MSEKINLSICKWISREKQPSKNLQKGWCENAKLNHIICSFFITLIKDFNSFVDERKKSVPFRAELKENEKFLNASN